MFCKNCGSEIRDFHILPIFEKEMEGIEYNDIPSPHFMNYECEICGHNMEIRVTIPDPIFLIK